MIEVKNLTKKFGRNIAVNDVSFEVKEGEVLGFLGPNGAGKTTTMSIMTGYKSSTSGSIKINGIDILENPEKVKSTIGYLPDTPPLYNDLTVYEYLSFVYDIKKLNRKGKKEALENIMEQVKITDMQKRLTKNLSKGYRQRVGLAQALLGNPLILILDEPNVGLDPKQIIEMREIIKGLSKKRTIILSSHILADVSAICDRVMIMNKGEIVADDKPENLANIISKNTDILVRVKGDIKIIVEELKNIEGLESIKEITSPEDNAFDLEIKNKDGYDIRNKIVKTIINLDCELLMIKHKDINLEQIFLEVTNNDVENPKENIINDEKESLKENIEDEKETENILEDGGDEQ